MSPAPHLFYRVVPTQMFVCAITPFLFFRAED